MYPKICLLLLFAELKTAFGAGMMIPGVGCGIITPIRMVDKPTETDACVLVSDSEAFQEYVQKIKEERESIAKRP